MNVEELKLMLEPWKSGDRYNNVKTIIETIDHIFGLDKEPIDKVFSKQPSDIIIFKKGNDWMSLKGFMKAMELWQRKPKLDIVDLMTENIEWFRMLISVKDVNIDERIAKMASLLSSFQNRIIDNLKEYNLFVSKYADYHNVEYACKNAPGKIYRKFAYESNPHFTILEAQRYYWTVMEALTRDVLYDCRDVRYDPMGKKEYGGLVRIDDMAAVIDKYDIIERRSIGELFNYSVMHNVLALINKAMTHVSLYDWIIEESANK